MVRRVAAGLVPSERASGSFPCLTDRSWGSLEHAVLVDSLACHVDEFDSLHPRSATVPAAVVVPTVLALASWLDAPGQRLLDAVIAGYDVLTSVAHHFGGPALYQRSWWPTSTFGALGSAAAACVLLELDEDTTANALGIAASGAGGLLSADCYGEGHYLSAAQNAVFGAQAALRARAGMEASWTLLDGPASAAFGEPADAGSMPRGGSVKECVAKWYPCARPLHGFIEGLLELQRSGADLRSLSSVEVAVHPDLARFISTDTEVHGPTEAAASFAFALCATAHGRETDPTFFREARLAWDGPTPVATLVPTVDEPFTWESRLSCRSSTGTVFETVGRPDERRDQERVGTKFLGNAAAAGVDEAVAVELLASLSGLVEVKNTRTLLAPLMEQPA